MSAAAAPGWSESETCKPRPVLKLFTERLLLHDEARGGEFQEHEVAVLQLCFDYGNIRVRICDERDGFFVSSGEGTVHVPRDRAAERQAQCVLEGFGAVELQCLGYLESESEADYLVHVSDNVHAICSFSAYAVPQLEQLGWSVEIAPDYPYRVIESAAPWYASVQPQDEHDDWFSLELGVDVDGQRINLLPGLLEVLNNSADSESLVSIFRAPAKFRGIRVADDRYAVLPPERLRRLLYILEELYNGESNEQLPLSRQDAGVLGEIEDTLEESGQTLNWSGAREVIDQGRALSTTAKLAPVRPATGLRAVLRPYQQEGLEWLQHMRQNDRGGVLADDMGLGKTLQTISHLAVEKESGRMERPALIVVPKSLLDNWVREIRKFAPFLRTVALHGAGRHALYERVHRAHVIVTTYPTLVRDLERFLEMEFHLVVLDEAQTIKNAQSQVSSCVNLLRSTHRLCLTGTPVENNLSELWSLFNFLMPGFLGSRQDFRSRYQVPIERDRNEIRLLQLRRRVAPFILRRMKSTVAKDLPPKTELVRPIDICDDQRDLYESIRIAAHGQVRKVIKQKGLAGSAVAILDALMKLRQVCCDPRLVASPAARIVRSSAKFDFLMETVQLQLSQGHRILIFSQFTKMLGLIGQGLKERDIGYVELTGATQNRQAKCDDFESGKAHVFLISLKAGGTGLNLTSADTVIHYDPWWNPAAQAQATDRAYRIGQKRPVFVYNLIVAGSVEAKMLQLQQQKRYLADTILGNQSLGALSEHEVDELFQPLDDAKG